MSFSRILATAAAAFAAKKGMDHFNKAGGMSGMRQKMQGGQTRQGIEEMMARFGIKDGASKVDGLMAKLGGGGTAQGTMTGGDGRSITGGGGGSISSGAAGAAGGAGLASILGAWGGDRPEETMAAMAGDREPEPDEEETARLMLRAMIQAAKADGHIDADEQAHILGAVGENATTEEQAFVEQMLAAPVDARALADDTPDGRGDQVYLTSLMAIDPDHPKEIAYLRELAGALGMDEAAREALHTRVGAAPLPA